MSGVFSKTVALSVLVHIISNLPLLMGLSFLLVFFDFVHCVTRTKQENQFLGQSPGLPLVNIDLPQVQQSELIVELIYFSWRSVRASHITFIVKKFENNVISVAWDIISYVRSSAKKVFQPSLHIPTYSEVSKLSLHEKFTNQSFCDIFLKNP